MPRRRTTHSPAAVHPHRDVLHERIAARVVWIMAIILRTKRRQAEPPPAEGAPPPHRRFPTRRRHVPGCLHRKRMVAEHPVTSPYGSSAVPRKIVRAPDIEPTTVDSLVRLATTHTLHHRERCRYRPICWGAIIAFTESGTCLPSMIASSVWSSEKRCVTREATSTRPEATSSIAVGQVCA